MKSMSDAIHKMMKDNNYQSKYRELIAESMQDEDVQSFLQENEERLTPESIIRSSANIYEFVQEKKKILNNKKGIVPGFYPRLVINKNHIDVTYIPSDEKYQEMMDSAKKNRVKTYYMPKNIQEVSLAQIDATVERAELIDQVYRFIEEYIQAPRNFHRGLYLYGRFGVGKTYILGAMANELAGHGYESAMVHFPSFSYEVKQAISDNTTSEKIDPLRQAPILVIDDIGADSMSSWLRDDVLGVILQHRMQEQLPTFFTSNFSLDELETHLTYSQKGENEPIKAKRIMERVRYLAKPVELDGENRRLMSE